MAGSVFKEVLRRSWRQVIYWGLGLAALGFYIMAFIQDVDVLKQYAEIAKAMPPILLQMFGASSATSLGTPEGFISFGFFGYTLLILAVYAVLAGLNVTANEEDSGIMDILLSLPLPRWRIVLEKFAAYGVMAVLIIAVGFAGLWLGKQTTVMEINMTRVAESTLNMVPSMLVMIAATMFAAAVFRRKSTATGIVAAFIVVSYFVDFMGKSATGTFAETLRKLSFFTYYDNQSVIMTGLNVGNIVILLAAAALLVAGTVWAFDRRDVGI